MSIIYVLLAISVIIAVLFFIAFIISVKTGQYDDTYTPSVRMLFEDEVVKEGIPPSTLVSPEVIAEAQDTSEKNPTNLNTKDA